MKLDGLEHPKTLQLASRLNVRRTTAIGHLELLWAFTAKHAAQGDIGKWPDGAIARACDWEGDAKEFVGALIEAGFLDVHPQHRLLIHDWREHAQGWVRAKLKKLGLDFISTSERSSETTSDGSSDETDEKPSEPSSRARVPSLAKPSPAKPENPPNPPTGGESAHTRSPKRKPRDLRAASLDAWDRSTKTIDKIPGTPLTWEDAKRLINDPNAHDAIIAIGGYKAVADRTEFTRGEMKRRFREHYEQQLQNSKKREGESAAPNGQAHSQVAAQEGVWA